MTVHRDVRFDEGHLYDPQKDDDLEERWDTQIPLNERDMWEDWDLDRNSYPISVGEDAENENLDRNTPTDSETPMNEDVPIEEDPQPAPEHPVRQTRTNTGAIPRQNYKDLATGTNSNFLIKVMAVLQNNDNGDPAELDLPANDDPMTWDQAKASAYWFQFQEAMKEEMR